MHHFQVQETPPSSEDDVTSSSSGASTNPMDAVYDAFVAGKQQSMLIEELHTKCPSLSGREIYQALQDWESVGILTMSVAEIFQGPNFTNINDDQVF